MKSSTSLFIGGPSDGFRPSNAPDDWRWVPLREVARLETGHTPDRNTPEYWNGNVPWVSLQDTGRLDVGEIFETAFAVTEKGIANSSARVLPAGTVVFSRTATVGKATILGTDMATSQDFMNYVCGESIHNQYLMYALRGMGRTWKTLMAGSTHNTIYMPDFKKLRIILPSMPEQRKIAAILSTWDRAIELTEKLIAAKQRRKQALMQQLLAGKVRLPGFGNDEWKPCRLGDVASNSARRIGNGGERKLVYSVTNSVGMVPMHDGTIGENIDRYKVVGNRDFAYNPMRLNVGSISMWKDDREVLVSPDYVVFRCTKKLDPDFLNHFRKTHYWRHYVNRAGGGSVRVRIYFKDLAPMPLLLPGRKEQKAIARVLNFQDRELKLLQRRAGALKQQKKGLMQQLLTGKVRVKPAKENA